MEPQRSLTAFAGDRLIATGPAAATLLRAKQKLSQAPNASVLVFDDANGRQLDFDWRGTDQEFLKRLASHPFLAQDFPGDGARSGPGRPKLGVVSREVTLLPRHWDWLQAQPQGASATLRRLVDEGARRATAEGGDQAALAAADKVLWTLAGDRPGCEEASRALYAHDWTSVQRLAKTWPKDIQAYLEQLLKKARGSRK